MSVEPKVYYPRTRTALAVRSTSQLADMHRIAAWVIEGGGMAWVKSGNEDQGPDMLYISNGTGGIKPVLSGQWIVVNPNDKSFEILSHAQFIDQYAVSEDEA